MSYRHGCPESKKSDPQVQMGVSAVFVSCLALQKLPSPRDPPENDVEQLAATLQPIVLFVVLGSIIIRKKRDKPSVLILISFVPDGLSPPFFSLVKQVHSQTLPLNYTWSRSVSKVPHWVLGMPRVLSPKQVSMPEAIATRDDQNPAMQSTPTMHLPSLRGSLL